MTTSLCPLLATHFALCLLPSIIPAPDESYNGGPLYETNIHAGKDAASAAGPARSPLREDYGTNRQRARAAGRQKDSAHDERPRHDALGRLLLDARQEEPGGHRLSRSRERLHRRDDQVDGCSSGEALQGDALADKGDRPERPVPFGRLPLLHPYGGG